MGTTTGDLAGLNCRPVRKGMPGLSVSEINYYQEKLNPGWKIIGSRKIRRDFNFDSFKDNIEFVNKVTRIAETERHHPDIYNFCTKVTIEISTHIIKGLSENDFILASKIDSL